MIFVRNPDFETVLAFPVKMMSGFPRFLKKKCDIYIYNIYLFFNVTFQDFEMSGIVTFCPDSNFVTALRSLGTPLNNNNVVWSTMLFFLFCVEIGFSCDVMGNRSIFYPGSNSLVGITFTEGRGCGGHVPLMNAW